MLLQDQKLHGDLSSLREPLLGGLPRAERSSSEEERSSQAFLALPTWSRSLASLQPFTAL